MKKIVYNLDKIFKDDEETKKYIQNGDIILCEVPPLDEGLEDEVNIDDYIELQEDEYIVE